MIHNYLSQVLFIEFINSIDDSNQRTHGYMDKSGESQYPTLLKLFMYADAIDKGLSIPIPGNVVDEACDFVERYNTLCIQTNQSLSTDVREQLKQHSKDYYDKAKISIKSLLRDQGLLAE